MDENVGRKISAGMGLTRESTPLQIKPEIIQSLEMAIVELVQMRRALSDDVSPEFIQKILECLR